MGKGMGDFMRQAQKLQEQIQKIQEEVAEKTVEASSGGGMVTVVTDGKQDVVSIKIDPEVVNKDDIEMLEDLIVAAVNEARKRSQELVADELGKITGGMGVPGLF